jgi:hypothetical protein
VDAGAAGSPTISISPTTVPLGQQVTVDLSGFPTVPSPVPWGVMLCPASWAATGDHAEAAWHCTLIEGTVATSVPAQVVVNAVDGGSPIAGGDLFTCVGPAGTCVIAGVQLDQSFRATAYAQAPITITAPVSSVSLGSSSVASGGTTTVTTTGFPAGVVTIGVCLRATTAANALSWCDPLTTQASGSTSTSVRVPYTNRLNGSLENCTACDIGAYVIDPAQPDRVITFASAPITVTPPTLDLAPAGPYDDGQTVTVTSAGIRPGNVEVALCASITSDLSHCGPATSVTIGPDWQLSTTIAMQRMIVAPPGNTARTRCESSCQVLVRAAAPADHQFVLASTQVAVRQPAVEIDQLGPFRDLQGVTVKVTGFPAATARVVQCRAPVAATLSADHRGRQRIRADRPERSRAAHAVRGPRDHRRLRHGAVRRGQLPDRRPVRRRLGGHVDRRESGPDPDAVDRAARRRSDRRSRHWADARVGSHRPPVLERHLLRLRVPGQPHRRPVRPDHHDRAGGAAAQ